jgi:hypothetical protein
MDTSAIEGWLIGRLPDGWFLEPAEITTDRDEITVRGRLAEPELEPGCDEHVRTASCSARVRRFREDTRQQRMDVAAELEASDGRKVAWGVRCGDVEETFTQLGVPVMTRLRQPERLVLDTLIDAGVARSRSEALAWCVRLVGTHQAEWIGQLRDALAHVQQVRSAGPR